MNASAQASSAASLALGVPLPADRVAQAVNPDHLPVYRGPSAAIRGTISASGDAAPIEKLPNLSGKCAHARDFYAPLFREGMQRALADVLVTVTDYAGYVPAPAPAVRVIAQGCTWGTRTIALTFGQRLEVHNQDRETYLPRLKGAPLRAQLVLVPKGDPVNLYPEQAGRYALTDTIHSFMFADVFVLKFATFQVTGLDGRYEIAGVPAGEVTVSALLPVTLQVVTKKLRVLPGQTATLDFQIAFDAKKWREQKPQDQSPAFGK